MRRSCSLLVALAALALDTHARGDQVTIRGAYYREPSTRVIQPVVDIEKDLPQGYDINAHYLVDAITSASAAAGTTVDSIFTEIRNEVGLGVGKNWERTRATLSYRYSAESDYWSHGLAGSLAQRLWGDTATVALALGVSWDSMQAAGRTPECAPPGTIQCFLNSYFGGVSYTQVLSPVAIAQVDAEVAFLDGFQGNMYRLVPNLGYERPPDRRLRNALAGRVGYYFPSTSTGLQLFYRYYWDLYPGTPKTPVDPWQMQAHTVEGRIYQQLTRSLELRLLYRYHRQSKAEFWCDVTINPNCYEAVPAADLYYYSSDPKLGPVHTHYPEIKFIWAADALRTLPLFRWFAAGTFELSYGYYIQNDSFGNAHVLQAGYTMPY
ncbi:MAG TPA: DUF3570 domain-containing protein [Polyangia bacterium]|nr:DUF3570 domain-containing protein [Polyangia bacterium]